MDICKTILEVITHALESEELRLKPHSERPGEPLWPWSMRGYPKEAWISYLLVRELSDCCPKLKMQPEAKSGGLPRRKVDLLIWGRATVELKGPYKVKESVRKIPDTILKDFEKQRRRANEKPKLQHLVLLILHARKSKFDAVQEWLDRLESKVRENNPGICIELQPSKPLDLNLGNEPPWQMMCCLYSVR